MIILDTNVISEFMRKAPDPRVQHWAEQQRSHRLTVTTITVAEIGRGIARLPAGKRRSDLDIRFEDFMTAAFQERVLPFDLDAARVYGTLAAGREHAGLHADAVDLMIASIAHIHGATIATRNLSDFEGCGLDLVDPWTAE